MRSKHNLCELDPFCISKKMRLLYSKRRKSEEPSQEAEKIGNSELFIGCEREERPDVL